MRQFITRRHAGRLRGLGRGHDRARGRRRSRRRGGGAAAKADGKQLFTAGNPQTGATACGACHTLSAAGTTAQTGPNLDKVLKGWDAARIQEAITNPGKEIAKGFGANIMPPNYAADAERRRARRAGRSTSRRA